ncbi:MAG TPA: hypothetical protein VG963_12890 [Polyangiaceae bacterium]|nr:hypothetical protein [Polyangiaceae bacterium]
MVSLPELAPAKPDIAPSTRLGAAAVLGAVLVALGYGAYSAYTASRDAFVVPTILSPSSDAVVATKLRLGELRVERVRSVAELEGAEADLSGAEQALGRLVDLKRTTGDAKHWHAKMTSQRVHESSVDVASLSSQKEVLTAMLSEQTRQTQKAQKELDAGLISRADYARLESGLNQTRLALLDNERAAAHGETTLQESSLAQQALQSGAAPQSPELASQQEQLIRVDLEIVRLDAERRAKTAERDALVERIAQIDEMVEQIEERPLYQALEKDLELAFVPYTQLPGVTPGQEVYNCLWGVVWCHEVGTVAQRVPGEVVQPDPWGSSTRGEYVVLALDDHAAAHAKTLRIRSWKHDSRPANTQPVPTR